MRLAFVDNGTARESLSHTPETRDPDVFLALLPSNKAAARGKTLFREEEPRHQKSLSRPAYQRGRKGPHERGYMTKNQYRPDSETFSEELFFRMEKYSFKVEEIKYWGAHLRPVVSPLDHGPLDHLDQGEAGNLGRERLAEPDNPIFVSLTHNFPVYLCFSPCGAQCHEGLPDLAGPTGEVEGCREEAPRVWRVGEYRIKKPCKSLRDQDKTSS